MDKTTSGSGVYAEGPPGPMVTAIPPVGVGVVATPADREAAIPMHTAPGADAIAHRAQDAERIASQLPTLS